MRAVLRHRAWVAAARTLQVQRFRGTRMRTNADMGPAEVRQLHLSARAYHRVLKLAHTITDLAGVPDIGPAHLAEAIQYRPRRVE